MSYLDNPSVFDVLSNGCDIATLLRLTECSKTLFQLPRMCKVIRVIDNDNPGTFLRFLKLVNNHTLIPNDGTIAGSIEFYQASYRHVKDRTTIECIKEALINMDILNVDHLKVFMDMCFTLPEDTLPDKIYMDRLNDAFHMTFLKMMDKFLDYNSNKRTMGFVFLAKLYNKVSKWIIRNELDVSTAHGFFRILYLIQTFNIKMREMKTHTKCLYNPASESTGIEIIDEAIRMSNVWIYCVEHNTRPFIGSRGGVYVKRPSGFKRYF